jgi:hypothetical protein
MHLCTGRPTRVRCACIPAAISEPATATVVLSIPETAPRVCLRRTAVTVAHCSRVRRSSLARSDSRLRHSRFHTDGTPGFARECDEAPSICGALESRRLLDRQDRFEYRRAGCTCLASGTLRCSSRSSLRSRRVSQAGRYRLGYQLTLTSRAYARTGTRRGSRWGASQARSPC